MYLGQYIARSGVCSRRKAIDEIKAGNVTVNGDITIDPSYQVQENDRIAMNDRIIRQEGFVYLLLNKPKGILTACSDNRGRATVVDIIKYHKPVRLYPVGRLDKETTGALIITNDGDFAQSLAHPKFNIPKTYFVKLNKPFTYEDQVKIEKGLYLHDGRFRADQVFYPQKKNKWLVGLTIHSGKYRIIRRVFFKMGYTVKELERVKYGNLTLKSLARGQWREISPDELTHLQKK